VHDGSSLAIWIFLGFCALVVAAQLLPIFRVKLVPGRVDERQATQGCTPREKK
jgi:hypothetical protein